MQVKKSKIGFMVLSGLLISQTSWADIEPSATPIDFSGFIDGSYNYLSQSNLFISNVYDRVYDLNENGVTLQQAAGTVSYLPKVGIGGLLNAMVGRDSIVSNAYGMGT